jgi:hypothetical protein
MSSDSAFAQFQSQFNAISQAYAEAKADAGRRFPPDGVYTVVLTKIETGIDKFQLSDQKDGPTVPCFDITPHYIIPEHAAPAISGMEFTGSTMRLPALAPDQVKKLPDGKQTNIRINLSQFKGFYQHLTGQEASASLQNDVQTVLDLMDTANSSGTAIQLDVSCASKKTTAKNGKEYTNRNVYINRLVQGVAVAPKA